MLKTESLVLKLLGIFLLVPFFSPLITPQPVEALYYSEVDSYTFSYEGPKGQADASKIVATGEPDAGVYISREEFFLQNIPTSNGTTPTHSSYLVKNSGTNASLIIVECDGAAYIANSSSSSSNNNRDNKTPITVAGTFNGFDCDVIVGDNNDQPVGSINYTVTIKELNKLIEDNGSAGPFTIALLQGDTVVKNKTIEYTEPLSNQTVSFEFQNIAAGENYIIQFQSESGLVLDQTNPFTVTANETIEPPPVPHFVTVEELANGVGGEGESTPDCNSTQGGALGWVMCAGVEAITGVVGWFTSLLQYFLRVSPVVTQNADHMESSVHAAWRGVKNISLVVLVIAALIAVFGQSIGIEAYTVKKMLPRIIIASIATLLSFTLVAILVDVFNVLGEGVRDLFINAIDLSIEVNFASFITTTLAALVGGGAAAGAGLLWVTTSTLGAAAGTVALFVLLPLLMGVLSVFFTLIFRRILIVFLIVVSPIAFVAWTLPNTERYFKLWYDTLIKALLMYPMIMLLMASGQIYASIITSDSSSGVGNLLVGLLAVALPLFLVPFTFRFAGSAISGLNQWARGMGKRGTEFVKGDARDPYSNRNKLRSKRIANRGNFSVKDMEKHPFQRGVRRLTQKGPLSKIPGIKTGTREQILEHAQEQKRGQELAEFAKTGPHGFAVEGAIFSNENDKPVAGMPALRPRLDANNEKVRDEAGDVVYDSFSQPEVNSTDATMAAEIRRDQAAYDASYSTSMGGSVRSMAGLKQYARALNNRRLPARVRSAATSIWQGATKGGGRSKGRLGLNRTSLVKDKKGKVTDFRFGWELKPEEGESMTAVRAGTRNGSIDLDEDPRATNTKDDRRLQASQFMEDARQLQAWNLGQESQLTYESLANFAYHAREFGMQDDYQGIVDKAYQVVHGQGGFRDQDGNVIQGQSSATTEAQAAAREMLRHAEAAGFDVSDPSTRNGGNNRGGAGSRSGQPTPSSSTPGSTGPGTTTTPTTPPGGTTPGGVILPTDKEVDMFNRNREK